MEMSRATTGIQENQRPANNMTLAIVATIFGTCSPFCIGLILGIVAIVMASQVNTKFDSGDFEGAVKSAKSAKTLSYITFGLFALAIIIGILNIVFIGWDEIINEFQRGLMEAQEG